MSERRYPARLVEWPTLLLLILCYGGWVIGTTWLSSVSLVAGFVLTTLMITLHSSLQHEVLHGHPFRSRRLSEAAVLPAPGLMVPYMRFRDTHLAHHRDARLTDPYDDPEANFLDPEHWGRMPGWKRAALNFNNALLGRLIIGAAISQIVFMGSDLRAIRRGDRAVLAGWLWHIPGVALILWWLAAVGQMPLWLYLIAAYAGTSILKIRTFLEHRAHDRASGRSVVVEDRGLLALLFLNNNYHAVHHMHPAVPWYRLPAQFRASRDRYLERNDGYYYRSYTEIFRRYLLRRKDPVPHPIWPVR